MVSEGRYVDVIQKVRSTRPLPGYPGSTRVYPMVILVMCLVISPRWSSTAYWQVEWADLSIQVYDCGGLKACPREATYITVQVTHTACLVQPTL